MFNTRLIWILYLNVLIFNPQDSLAVGKPADSKKKFILELPHCKIPDPELLSDVILPEWNVPFTSVCEKRDRLASFINNTKILKFNSLSKYENCCYNNITRPEELVSATFELSECEKLKPDQELDMTDEDFIMVNCTKKEEDIENAKKPFEYEFHYNIPKTPERIEKKLKFWKTEKTKPFSIHLLIIDSISSLHGRRSLPKSLKYLQEKLGFIMYKGYHGMGEPTIENYIPMFMGIPTDHPGWDKKKPSYKGKWDHEPMIFQNFSRSNYITMDIEDMAYWHTLYFNGRKGFTKRPFDFDTRPYFLLQEKRSPRKFYRLKYGKTNLRYRALNCMDGKNVWDFLFDYSFEFLQQFMNVPVFAITWFGWPNHDFLPSTQKFDEPMLNFYKNLETNTTVLDNTITIVMGDHGFRWSNYSELKEGILERSLPMFLIRVPPKFAKMYPQETAELKANAERVTSHIDLFKTLVHLHMLQAPKSTLNKGSSYGFNQTYGTSLFTKIPEKRTCKEATIPDRFCACNYPLFDKNFDYEKYRKSKVVEGLTTLVANSKVDGDKSGPNVTTTEAPDEKTTTKSTS